MTFDTYYKHSINIVACVKQASVFSSLLILAITQDGHSSTNKNYMYLVYLVSLTLTLSLFRVFRNERLKRALIQGRIGTSRRGVQWIWALENCVGSEVKPEDAGKAIVRMQALFEMHTQNCRGAAGECMC